MDPNKSLKENEEMLGFKQIIALFSLNWLGLDASGNGGVFVLVGVAVGRTASFCILLPCCWSRQAGMRCW
jgi:hypothetical protein